MKKLILPILFLGMFSFSCGNKKDQQKETAETSEISNQAIEKIEKEAEVIEEKVDSLKAAAEKLDNLLNDLE
ncbi:hypothetical protein [Plebeiibacterium sediminum]|uniref:ABC transporter permease n=1 Tax=Plebeiibacterium sediminum TaxID=2992112 RepID=A0AAE3M6X1_9BACT|nr:hypothetical protein [Plebeiobacterium sediminum]MCW3788411.1 ABC transporter permease [Plebeiobacterium sediminum]